MSKLGAFGKITVEAGHAGDTVAVYDKNSGSISSGGVWHKANIFRRKVRSGDEKAQNQATRQAFFDAMGAAISKDGERLGSDEALDRLKEMLGDDASVLNDGFALDKDGKVTTNKPLTERRIALIVDKLKEHALEGTETGPRLGIRNPVRKLFDDARTKGNGFIASACNPQGKLAQSPFYMQMCKNGMVERLCMEELDLLRELAHFDSVDEEMVRTHKMFAFVSNAEEMNAFFEEDLLFPLGKLLKKTAAQDGFIVPAEVASQMAEEILKNLGMDDLTEICTDVFRYHAKCQMSHIKEGVLRTTSRDALYTKAEKDHAENNRINVFFEEAVGKTLADEQVKSKLLKFDEIKSGKNDEAFKHIPGLGKIHAFFEGKKFDADRLDQLILQHSDLNSITASDVIDGTSYYQHLAFKGNKDNFDKRIREFRDPLYKLVRAALLEKNCPAALYTDVFTTNIVDQLSDHILNDFLEDILNDTKPIDPDKIKEAVSPHLNKAVSDAIQTGFKKLESAKRRCVEQRKVAQERYELALRQGDNELAKLIKHELAVFDREYENVTKNENAGANAYKAAAKLIHADSYYDLIAKCANEMIDANVLGDVKTLLGIMEDVVTHPNRRVSEKELTDVDSLARKISKAGNGLMLAMKRINANDGADEFTEATALSFALLLLKQSSADPELKNLVSHDWSLPREDVEGMPSHLIQSSISNLIDRYTSQRRFELEGAAEDLTQILRPATSMLSGGIKDVKFILE